MKGDLRTTFLEATIVAIVGCGLALLANQVSPRGLVLSRDYFPAGTNSATHAPAPKISAPSPQPTSDADELSQRLRDKGLQEIKRPQVEALFHDPGYREGKIVFVDARDEDHYQDGHIPGAYELDPYHPENQINAVMPVCQAAEQIVVYCTGGECEDADSAAIILHDAGIPAKKIFVYGGGYDEWNDKHLPLELGERNSGQMAPAK